MGSRYYLSFFAITAASALMTGCNASSDAPNASAANSAGGTTQAQVVANVDLLRSPSSGGLFQTQPALRPAAPGGGTTTDLPEAPIARAPASDAIGSGQTGDGSIAQQPPVQQPPVQQPPVQQPPVQQPPARVERPSQPSTGMGFSSIPFRRKCESDYSQLNSWIGALQYGYVNAVISVLDVKQIVNRELDVGAGKIKIRIPVNERMIQTMAARTTLPADIEQGILDGLKTLPAGDYGLWFEVPNDNVRFKDGLLKIVNGNMGESFPGSSDPRLDPGLLDHQLMNQFHMPKGQVMNVISNLVQIRTDGQGGMTFVGSLPNITRMQFGEIANYSLQGSRIPVEQMSPAEQANHRLNLLFYGIGGSSQAGQWVYQPRGVTFGNISACDGPILTPLMIDLSGEGFMLSDAEQGANFDLKGNGDAVRAAWPMRSNTVFLGMPNAQGRIESIHELFGANTIGPDGKTSENGFAALAKYDLNRDGIIDSKDAVYSKLVVWSNTSRDGISTASQFKTLGEAGIASIHLSYLVSTENDMHGNEFRQKSFVVMKDGSKRTIVDAWLVNHPIAAQTESRAAAALGALALLAALASAAAVARKALRLSA